MFNSKNISIGLVIVFIFFSCEDNYLSDDTFLKGNADSYDGFMEEGWASYTDGNYSESVEYFQSASERDATQPEVYLGLGWSQLKLMDLINAESNFQKVISFAFLDEDNATALTNNANAGMLFIELANGNYLSAITYGNNVIAENSNYSFNRDSAINSEAVLFSMAEAYYYLNRISESFDIMVELGNTFSTTTLTSDIAMVIGYYDNSAIDGLVNAGLNNGDHLLITVESATISGLTYDITEIYEGTNEFDIIGNPVPAIGDTINANYYYTTDYAEFMVELISKITQ